MWLCLYTGRLYVKHNEFRLPLFTLCPLSGLIFASFLNELWLFFRPTEYKIQFHNSFLSLSLPWHTWTAHTHWMRHKVNAIIQCALLHSSIEGFWIFVTNTHSFRSFHNENAVAKAYSGLFIILCIVTTIHAMLFPSFHISFGTLKICPVVQFHLNVSWFANAHIVFITEPRKINKQTNKQSRKNRKLEKSIWIK